MGSVPFVTVGAKRTMEYVLDALGRLNAAPEIELHAVGQCISKAADVTQILAHEFGVAVGDTRLLTLTRRGVRFSTASTSISLERGATADGEIQTNEFVKFPVYHLLLHDLLSRNEELEIAVGRQRSALLKLRQTPEGFKWTPAEALQESITKKGRHRQEALGDLVAAFSRAGLILSPRWEPLCTRIGQFDDVILGLDTNVIYECVVTQQMLDGFVLTSPLDHVHSPNWLLLVVPNTVMHEIEQAANSRRDGRLTLPGRMGYRALQEILEIDQSTDLRGLSLLIAGEANPILDARVELQGLREDFRSAASPDVRPRLYRKLSAGDTLIRDQFKAFLRQISFHKGAYFLTGDKSNSALGLAEGLHSIYFPLVPWSSFLQMGNKVEPPEVPFDDATVVHLTCPIGKLCYELAVQFETIRIEWGPRGKTSSVELGCDLKGESLEHWVQRELRISAKDLKTLISLYGRGEPKVSLRRAQEVWDRRAQDSMDWL